MVIDKVTYVAEKFRDRTILVGLSGGADSICLTHVLKTAGFKVAAAHINHCLRGEESDGDEAFVRNFCKRLEIPLFVKRADVATLAKNSGRGLEDEGRKVRYEFFSSVDIPDKIIATAHNKCDNAETVLLNLIRGSGGLRGIPLRDDVIRPLLNVTRSEIEEYCCENNLEFRTDSSNLSTDYTRNKIRLEIIPELKKINPSVEDAILRACEISGLDREVAETAAFSVKTEKRGERWYVNSADMPQGVLLRVIRQLYSKVYGSEKNLSYENVKSAAELAKSGKTGKLANLGNEIFLETVYGGFLVGRLPEKQSFSVELEGEVDIPCASVLITASLSDFPKGRISFDAEKTGKLTARSRIPGDRLCINGKTKKLKDIFIDRKIPIEDREKTVVLESGGVVVGALDIGFDSKFLANDKTVRFFNLDWRKYNG